MSYDLGGGIPRRRSLPPPSTGEVQGCAFLTGGVLVVVVVVVLILLCCGVAG